MTASESLASPRLWLAFATMLVVSGIGNTFPVFFPALLEEFGGSRAATAATVSLVWLVGAALGPVAGHLVDRWSPRLLVVAGLGATALGMAGAIVAPTLPLFVLALGVGGGVGVGLSGMVTQAAVIAETYVRRRGFATGIAFSGSMAGYVLSTPAQSAIEALGWRATLAGYLVVVLILIPFAAAIYPARLAARVVTAPAAAPPAGTRTMWTLVRTPAFWALAFVFTVAPLVGYLATLQHALYFASLGFPAHEAAIMLTLGGVLSTSGRALVGLVADRFGAPLAGVASLSMSLLGTLCLAGLEAWPGRVLAYAYVLLVFGPLGTRAVVVSLLVPRLAAPARFGAVFGVLVMVNSAGAGLGPFLSGAI
ncbi:MAG TPA: MFS transporter, partial [Methylomirabilota bacterium]|nr:MFS transporter [Methylomirabilota bacterium]